MRPFACILFFVSALLASSQSYVDSGIRHFMAKEYDEALMDFEEAEKVKVMFTESSVAKIYFYRGLIWLERAEKGDFAEAALVEGLVAFSVLAFGSIVAPMAGRLGGVAAAAFYCLAAHYEGCKYTCSIMNPATIFALHLVLGGKEHFMQRATWEKQAAYWAGGCGGAAAAGITVLLVAWLFTRKAQPGKKKKAE